jgi:hypothetical protein
MFLVRPAFSVTVIASYHAIVVRHSPGFTAGGYTRALLGATIFVAAAILIGLRAANTKGQGPDAVPPEISRVATPGDVNGTPKFPAHSSEETTLPG